MAAPRSSRHLQDTFKQSFSDVTSLLAWPAQQRPGVEPGAGAAAATPTVEMELIGQRLSYSERVTNDG
jgi:hypothetical protein